MIHIVNVSGGAASAVCLFRVIERFGRENVRAVFADTRSEHPDCYRFLDDVERVSGVPLERLSDGLDCWDVWLRDFALTSRRGGCKASWELKRLPLDAHRLTIDGDVTIYVGFGRDEDDRQIRLERVLRPQRVEFPLCWEPFLFRCDCLDDLRARGIEPPSMYADGYPHANCAGACVLAGIKQWAGLLGDNPTLFDRYEQNEQKFLGILRSRDRGEHTILKDRRGGTVQNYSLRQLREDVERGVRLNDDSWRQSQCTCMLF